MARYIVFDLDGTLAKVGQPCPPSAVEMIRELEDGGARIVLSSGKPSFYLCGFARQMGLRDPILIGENGGTLQVGVELPPPVFKKAAIPEVTREALMRLRALLEEKFPQRIWFQPNETALTPFPSYLEDFPPIRALLEDFIKPEMALTVYEHPDCFDIVYSALSKGDGIRLLSQVTGEDPKDFVAVGDWTNDYPMFRAVGYSVGIHLPDADKATVNVPDLESALSHLLSFEKESRQRKL